jgi:hypothetical protein
MSERPDDDDDEDDDILESFSDPDLPCELAGLPRDQREELRQHSYYRGGPTNADAMKLFEECFATLYPNGMPQISADAGTREDARQARADDELKAQAQAYARTALDSIKRRALLTYAAPSGGQKRAKVKTQAMSYVAPKLTDRMRPFVACQVGREFEAVAKRLGVTATVKMHIRLELTFWHLQNGTLPPFNLLYGKRPPNNELNLVAVTMFGIFNEAHRDVYEECVRLKLKREIAPIPLRSKNTTLVANLFQAFTDLRFGNDWQAARSVLNALAPICADFLGSDNTGDDDDGQ